jgi:hypothetical protein
MLLKSYSWILGVEEVIIKKIKIIIIKVNIVEDKEATMIRFLIVEL